MNTYKEKESDNDSAPKRKSKNKDTARSFVDVLNGSMLSKDFMVQNITYLFFLTFLLVCYIGYGYYADRIASDIVMVQEEMDGYGAAESTALENWNRIKGSGSLEDSTKILGLTSSNQKAMAPIKIVVPKGYFGDTEE